MTDGRLTTGPRLRDKKWPSSYDMCACGMAKVKTARRCARCVHATSRGERRDYDLCACGGEKKKASARCGACQRAAWAAARVCGCGNPKRGGSIRCRRCACRLGQRIAAERRLDARRLVA